MLAALLAGWLLLPAVAAADSAVDASAPSGSGLVILVRHAEKSAQASDPPLSAPGGARALALRDALAGFSLAGIIVSDTRRTLQTAAPTAALHQLTPIVASTASGMPAHVADIVQRVHELSGQGAVLVVGHSNTLPAVVKALGGSPLLDLAECEFDTLWLLDLRDAESPPGLIRVRYGAPSACDSATR
ncbi:MAG TPA: phosphoglycerate mutase family protein [Fontimonas sp.]